MACVAPANCWAVGEYAAGRAFDLNEVLRWNGRKWSTVPNASPGGNGAGDFSNLIGMACASSTDCWAFGEYGTLEPTQNFLNEVLHWNGRRWSVVAVPEPGGTSGGANQLLSRGSCHSSTDCWAVGSYVPNGGDTLATLNEAMHWDGHSWSQVPTPDPGGFADNDISELSAVRCQSSDNCWAVGDQGIDGETLLNQVLHWNGSSWSVG